MLSSTLLLPRCSYRCLKSVTKLLTLVVYLKLRILSRSFISSSISANCLFKASSKSSSSKWLNTRMLSLENERHQVSASPFKCDTTNRHAVPPVPKPTESTYYRISKIKLSTSVFFPEKVDGRDNFTSRGTNVGWLACIPPAPSPTPTPTCPAPEP